MESPLLDQPKLLLVAETTAELTKLASACGSTYCVLTAHNVEAALEVLSHHPDIAVLMTEGHWLQFSQAELLQRVAQQYPDMIRISLIQATQEQAAHLALKQGHIFKYVVHPFERDALQAVIQQSLAAHQLLKHRTQELNRSLRQESILNAIATALRDTLDYQQLLQTLVEIVAEVFNVDICLLRPLQAGSFTQDWFSYDRQLGGAINLDPQNQAFLAKTVWATETPLPVADVATESLFQAMVSERESLADIYSYLNICSTFILPLVYRQDLIAVMGLHQRSEPRTWQADDVRLMNLVASQAAPIVAQALAYEQIRALAQREQLINTITSTIRSSLEPKTIFTTITQQLGEALQVDGCALFLNSSAAIAMQCVGLYTPDYLRNILGWPIAVATTLGEPSPLNSTFLAAYGLEENSTLAQSLDQQTTPLVIDDLAAFLGGQPLDVQEFVTLSLMLVPLLGDDGLMGCIALRQAAFVRTWQPKEVDLAQAVASQAAIAVQQARLYAKTRQQAEQLLQLNQQKNELFQNISHEFRTPLTLTMGPLETVVGQRQGLSYEQSAVALQNSRRLLRLVNQLLDLQRLDSGSVQPCFYPFQVHELLSQIVSSFRPYCEKRDLKLETNIVACNTVYLDPEKFDKVIYNLLSNAMKFTRPGGTISVRVQPVEAFCQIQVEDNGIGIRPDQLPLLFKRFHQAEGSANRRYEGSGLGLAIVKKLIEVHGGTIQVQSVYGQGSTFTIRLPFGKEHLPPAWVV
ncbi:MAG: ATP-binding protein, partial [Cyanobacteria bacterium P01_H01_bin.121]